MAVSKSLRFQILRRDGFKCRYCGLTATETELVAEHVIPVALGGKDEASNLVASCRDCNAGKAATPPDAPMVAQVEDDALRWAQAITTASARMLDDLAVRRRAWETFNKAWCSWLIGEGDNKKPVPMPDDWKATVDRFTAAGLPIEVLVECVEKAMTAKKVKVADVFRYMCGIAWKKVTEMQESARAIVADSESMIGRSAQPGDDDRSSRHQFAVELLDQLDPDERKWFQKEARAWADDPKDPIACEIDAAMYAFVQLRHDVDRLGSAIEQLLRLYPDDAVAECRDYAADEYRSQTGEDPPRCDLLVHTVREIIQRRQVEEAQEYLAQLPDDERAEWLACAATYLGYGEHPDDLGRVEIKAAEYARMNKANGLPLKGLCSGRGASGAMCPEKASYLMSLETCVGCGGACTSHPVCERHLESVIDGKVFSLSTGKAVVVRDFEEIPPHPEEPPF